MAIDYGTKRTGLATTDEEKKIAFPLHTEKTNNLFVFLTEYLKNNLIDRFVVGLPRRFDTSDTHSTKHVERFIRKLKSIFPEIPIDRMDERFTSSLAKHAILESGLKKSVRADKKLIDMTSATIILQSWIDAQANIDLK